MPRIRFMEVGHITLNKPPPIVKDIKIHPQIRELLQRPTWSVSSLLPPRTSKQHDQRPPKNARSPDSTSKSTTAPASSTTFQESTSAAQEITPSKLQHLLKLSALPPPKSPAEESEMLATLRAQVHFVKEIQKVDTSGVEPLVSIRDETRDHIWSSMMTEEKLAQYFVQEDKVGVNGTVRRQKDNALVISGEEDMSPYSMGERELVEEPFRMGRDEEEGRRIGRYFYVKRSKKNTATGQEHGLEKKQPVDPA